MNYITTRWAAVPAILITSLLLSACSSGSSVTKTDSEDVLQQIVASYRSTPNLKLHGDMKITGVPATVWFDAYMKERDSLKLMMNGPFGIQVGALSATPNEFSFFDVINNEVITGTPNRETFQKLMMIGLEYQEIAGLMRGELPTIPASGTYATEVEDGRLVYTHTSGGIRETFTVDPSQPFVEAYTRGTVSGKSVTPIIAIAYSKPMKVGERYFGRQVKVEIAEGDRTLSVNFDKITDSLGEDIMCALTLPASIPRRKM